MGRPCCVGNPLCKNEKYRSGEVDPQDVELANLCWMPQLGLLVVVFLARIRSARGDVHRQIVTQLARTTECIDILSGDCIIGRLRSRRDLVPAYFGCVAFFNR